MKNQFFAFFITIVILVIPLALVFMMEREIMAFTIGEVDSWIMFWGSYIGAIIGASFRLFCGKTSNPKAA